MGKDVEIRFSDEAYAEYDRIRKLAAEGKHSSAPPDYSQLLSSIDHVKSVLKTNPFFGDLIPRKYLNSKILRKYGTDKIFRIELVGFWRLLYTVVGDEIKIIAFVLEFMDHKEYNTLFGYRKK